MIQPPSPRVLNVLDSGFAFEAFSFASVSASSFLRRLIFSSSTFSSDSSSEEAFARSV